MKDLKGFVTFWHVIISQYHIHEGIKIDSEYRKDSKFLNILSSIRLCNIILPYFPLMLLTAASLPWLFLLPTNQPWVLSKVVLGPYFLLSL